VQRGPNGTFVYVIGADSTVAPRQVEVASTAAETSVIARGLEEGERVVVDGQNQLRTGSRVAVREPGAGKPADQAKAPEGGRAEAGQPAGAAGQAPVAGQPAGTAGQAPAAREAAGR